MIEKVCDYCHLRNVKVYVAVNTIYKETELKGLLNYISSLERIGVDALIMQDLGAAKLIKERFEIQLKLPAHSLQQTLLKRLRHLLIMVFQELY